MNHALNRRAKWPAADIYGITAEEYSNGRSNIEVVRAMIDAGVKIIQYREKDKKKLYKYRECLRIREMTQKAGVTFIINDDIDLALLIQPDGVHIGQEDLPIEAVRKLAGEEVIIGLSTHSPQQARDAVQRGADYIGVGPVFATQTKKDASDAVGLDYVKYVAEHIPLPSVAIGGINTDNITSVKQAGADCFALITDIVGAADIGARIKELQSRLA